jgi:hypothetical protein
MTSQELMAAIVTSVGTTRSKSYLLLASQIVFRYRLLDIMADVLDFPKHPEFREVQRMPRPDCGVKLFWTVSFFILT